TIATLLGDLQARGLVVETADGDGRPGGRGRPPALLRLDPSAGAAVGVDFGHTHVRVAVADLSSTLLAERMAPIDVDGDAAGALGHGQVQPDGVVCNCGGRGCLQTVAAVPSLLGAARAAHGPELTLQGLVELVAQGDFGVRRIVGEAGRAVGRVLSDLCNLVN